MTAVDISEQTHTELFNSLDEAKQRLFRLYNNNYQILNKRPKLCGGILGFGQKEKLEITYRILEKFKDNELFSEVSRKREDVSDRLADKLSFERNQTELLKNLQAQMGQPVLQTQMNELVKQISELNSKIDAQPTATIVAASEEHINIQKIEDLLSRNEFTYSYIKRIKDRLKSEFSLDKLEDFKLVQRQVVDWIGESINVSREVSVRLPRTVILVGPTGVGKTTTLVKLAAQNVIAAKHTGKVIRMCFISTDSMRVGAQEQLERWVNLFDIKLEKAENAEDVRNIFEKNKNSVDMIFIDTGGYSPNDAAHIGRMKATLDVPGMNPEIYLAVTASTKARDLVNIMQNYEPFGYKSVIITKCDESNQYGNVISVLSERNKSVSYITNGQKAAGCIEKADVVSFLKRLEDFEIDRIHIEDKFGVN